MNALTGDSYLVSLLGAVSVLVLILLLTGVILLVVHQISRLTRTPKVGRMLFIEWVAALLYVIGGFFALTLLMIFTSDTVALSPKYNPYILAPAGIAISLASLFAGSQLRAAKYWAYQYAIGLCTGLGLIPILSLILAGNENGSFVFTLFFLPVAFQLIRPKYRQQFIRLRQVKA